MYNAKEGMYITNDIIIPWEVMDAQDHGKLVIFAGAGVSMEGIWKDLDFKGLVRRIVSSSPQYSEEYAERFEKNNSSDEGLDFFLQKIDKDEHGIQVHKRVHRIFSDPNSKPTVSHKNLLKLFKNKDDVRIVTTNYDKHFSTVAKKQFEKGVNTYYAPALPLGSNFNGIVYLHGSVIEEKPEKLVVTAEDFSRAYITEGWATQFLKNMFEQYTVLFVGYSHNDLMMQYLSYGLLYETKRFALNLVNEYNRDKICNHWQSHGIKLISYPKNSKHYKEHEKLDECICEWANLTQMNYLDHKVNIREKVIQAKKWLYIQGKESDYKKESSYIMYALTDVAKTRIFYNYADDPKWLAWTDKNVEDFKAIFRENVDISDVSKELSRWFAYKYVFKYPQEARNTFNNNGSTVSSYLWHCIIEQLWRNWLSLSPEIRSNWAMTMISKFN